MTCGAAGGGFQQMAENVAHISVGIFTDFSGYFLPVQPAHRIQNLSNFLFFFKKKKNIRCYLVIWSWFAGKDCIFQPGSKIVDGSWKLNPMAQKQRDPWNRSRKHREQKKSNFFGFLWGVLHAFSLKSNEDEFSRKSNGGWIFLGIKRGLQKNK